MKTQKLREWLNKNFLSLVYVISASILLINILSLYSIFTIFRTSNDECLWQPIKSATHTFDLVFYKVKPYGAAWTAGIRDGDRLLEINNTIITSSAQAQDLINKLPEGGIARYTYQRGSNIYTTQVIMKKLVDINSLSFSLLASFWFVVGFLVLIAKPDGYLQKLFFIIGVLFSIIRSTPILLPTLPANGYAWYFIIYYVVFIIALSLFPLYYFRFFAVFPGEQGKPLNKYIERVVIVIVILTAGFSYYNYFFPQGTFFINLQQPQMHTLAFANYSTSSAVLVNQTFLIGFFVLLIRYIRPKHPGIRKKIRLIVISYGLGLIGLLFFGLVVPKMGYIIYNAPEYFTPILLIVFLPIAFAISIFRYNLMDMSTVVKNAIFYGTATISLAILYFLVVLGLGNAIGAMVPQVYRNIVSLFFFVFFAIVFQTKKDSFQDLLTKKFYPEQFAYRKLLLTFNHKLSQIVGRENILDAFESLIVNDIKVQQTALLLKKSNEDIYRFERVRNFVFAHDELFVNPEKIVHAVNERKKNKAEAVFTQDNFHELFGAKAKQLIQQGVFTVVPFICGKHVPGFLLLGLKHSGSQFGGKDLTLLASVAGQVSISLENARLYEAEVQKIELEKELEVARRIQQNLLPKKLPANPRVDIYGKMVPAQHIGGDYFDIIEIDANRFFVAVGDVSGKGLPASLYMARVQTLVQAECRLNCSPRDVLIEVNKKLIGSMEKKSFITMSLAYFDLQKNIMTFCRAGHLPLMVKEMGVIKQYKTPGIGLGLDKGPIFEKSLQQEEFLLGIGQVYIFISDGINEAMDEENSCIGYESLEKVFLESNGHTSEKIADATWKSLAAFRKSAEPNDDMTLVILKMLA